MKAVILAAGQGKRLRPLTYGIPKPLLPVGGRPVIDYVLDNIEKSKKITEVYVAVSHMKHAIESYLKHSEHGKLAIHTVPTLGWETGGDLKTVLEEQGISSGPLLVCYGDNVTTLNIDSLLSAHAKNKGAYATLVLFKVAKKDVSRFGIAEVKGSSISRFIEKPAVSQTKSRLANAGYFVVDCSKMSKLPLKQFKLESEYFPSWAQGGNLFCQVQKIKTWIDIGNIDSYRKANRIVDKILPPPVVKP